jgi:hypothetical protein
MFVPVSTLSAHTYTRLNSPKGICYKAVSSHLMVADWLERRVFHESRVPKVSCEVASPTTSQSQLKTETLVSTIETEQRSRINLSVDWCKLMKYWQNKEAFVLLGSHEYNLQSHTYFTYGGSIRNHSYDLNIGGWNRLECPNR